MYLERICLISTAVLVAVSAAPSLDTWVTRSPEPTWHFPCCKDPLIEAVSPEDIEKETVNSVQFLKMQHQTLMNNYLHWDYNYLYEDLSSTLEKEHYISNWLPDENDVKGLTNTSSRTIANHFPKLHTDLQKFAVAFEQLVKDERDVKKREALTNTQAYLNSMLCEVECKILALPFLQLPMRVQRNIMSERERIPSDETNRLIRDWGVILKYRDYLHAWRHVFNY